MTKHPPNRRTPHPNNHATQNSESAAIPPTNTVQVNGQGQLCGVNVRILSPSACEATITTAAKYLQEIYGFTFTDRNLLSEALQPTVNEDIAIHGDRAAALVLASQFRAAQRTNRVRSSRNYYQHGVCNKIASNTYQGHICVKHGLHQFMFIQGGEDATGVQFECYGIKKLADVVEALMGVIREEGSRGGRNDWEVNVERWMSVFELDWEAADRYWDTHL